MLARVTPQLVQGGAEQEIHHLLRAFPGTRMLVTHLAGQVADDARDWAQVQVMPAADRWGPLVQSLRGVHTAHLHTRDHHVGAALMAQVAGVKRVIQSVHAPLSPASGALVDQQVMADPTQIELLDEPTLATSIVSGVPLPERLPTFAPWHQRGRRARIVELRGPGRPPAFDLAALAAQGGLGEVEFWVIGGEGPSCGRVRYLGQVRDVAPPLSRCDVLIRGPRAGGGGRAPLEAMAVGVIPALAHSGATHPSFNEDEAALLSPSPQAAGRQLLALLQMLQADPQGHARWRQRNFTRVASRSAVAAMVEQHRRLHSWAPERDRLVKPGELWDPVGTGRRLGCILEGGFSQDLADLCPAEQALTLWLMVALDRLPAGAHLRAMERANGMLPGRFVILRALAQARLGARKPHAALEAAQQASAIRPASRSAWMLQVLAAQSARGAQAAVQIAEAGVQASAGGEIWTLCQRLKRAA